MRVVLDLIHYRVETGEETINSNVYILLTVDEMVLGCPRFSEHGALAFKNSRNTHGSRATLIGVLHVYLQHTHCSTFYVEDLEEVAF